MAKSASASAPTIVVRSAQASVILMAAAQRKLVEDYEVGAVANVEQDGTVSAWVRKADGAMVNYRVRVPETLVFELAKEE